MPYRAAAELPSAVRRLSAHAQEIFLAAFNSAWESYAEREPQAREEIAFRIAWAAVKKRYRKAGGAWVEKSLTAS